MKRYQLLILIGFASGLAVSSISTAKAAVSVDATGSSSAPSSVVSKTWTHVIGASSNIILIYTYASSNGRSVNSVTVGGVNATKQLSLTENSGANGMDGEVWALQNPPTGPQTITVTWNAAGANVAATSISFNGSNGTIGSVVDSTTNSLSIASASGDMVSDALMEDFGGGCAANSPTVGGGLSQQFSLCTDESGSIAGSSASGAGSVAMTWSNTSGSILHFGVDVHAKEATDTTAPSVPVNLSATPVSSYQMNLSWAGSTDPDDTASQISYRVYRNGTAIAINAAGTTSYSDTGLSPSTSYTYAIAASDPAGNTSAQSSPAVATTQAVADATAPSVPTGLTASVLSSSRIDLSWTSSADPDNTQSQISYRVYRNGILVATTAAGSPSYSDTGLTASTVYTYTTSATDPAGNSSIQSTPLSATTQATALSNCSGTCFYVRAGATGAGSGTDWTNAYANLPATLQRGAIYYVGSGTYPAQTLATADNGTLAVTIKGATVADHGSGVGWSNAYSVCPDDGGMQAQFPNGWTVSTDYWTVDGACGGGSANNGTTVGYGFRSRSDAAGTGAIGFYFANSVSDITIAHYEIDGVDANDIAPTAAGTDGMLCGGGCNVNGLFDHLYIHDVKRTALLMGGNATLQYSYLARNRSTAAQHAEGWSYRGGTPIIRYNIFEDIRGTGQVVALYGTATNAEVYGNVFREIQGPCTGCNGSAFPITDNGPTGFINGLTFYNNTIYGLDGNGGVGLTSSGATCGVNVSCRYDVEDNIWYTGPYGISISQPAGSIERDNIVWNNYWYFGPAQNGTTTSGDNYICGSNANCPNANTPPTAAATFVSAPSNLHLSGGTVVGGVYCTTGSPCALYGTNLAAAYNTDMDGNIRGSGGTWSVGAYQYNNSSSDTLPPTASITAPTSGAMVSGTITVSATASDNVGVTKLELYVDNILDATDTTSPYVFSVDSTSLTNGSHTVFVKAYDAAGNIGTSGNVTIIVSNATTPAFSFTSVSTSQTTDTSVQVVVTTNQPAVMQVSYGPTIAYGQTTNASPLLTTAYFNLTNLQPNTIYDFMVQAVPPGTSTVTTSQNYLFTTSATPAAAPSGAGGSAGGGGGGSVIPPSSSSGGGSSSVNSGPSSGTPGGSLGTNDTGSSSRSASSTSSLAFPRTLTMGDMGPDVLALQSALQDLGYLPSTFAPTMYFGSLTQHALLLFQRDHQLNRSGFLDMQSQALLNRMAAQVSVRMGTKTATSTSSFSLTRYLTVGSRGADVIVLQKLLLKDGDYPEARITGYFGLLTQKAVQRFQVKHGIVSSGSPTTTGYGAVGRRTRSVMNKL